MRTAYTRSVGLLFTIIFSAEGRLSLGEGHGIKHPGFVLARNACARGIIMRGELATRQDVHLYNNGVYMIVYT